MLLMQNHAVDVKHATHAMPQLDEVSKSLRTNNAKLKGLVTKVRHDRRTDTPLLRLHLQPQQVRSTKMFIIDTILLCVLLGLALYIYNVVKK